MKIQKEGIPIILIMTLMVAAIIVGYFYFFSVFWLISVILCGGLAIFLYMVIRFFRNPHRIINKVENGILSPADGKVVNIQEIYEGEYFKDRRILISIFMSAHNVHVNSYPIDGTVVYVGYHPGKYLIAKLPKSSTDNENNSVVIKQNEQRIVLFRQIAGFVARRIICHAHPGMEVKQGEEMGMIKFGSRVDVFLPLDAQLAVQVGDKVRSKKSVLAYF
ncbi:MAG: phosphatidylserine decarboxylase family protein [Bacteroidales bacterium]|nr:phosphatidylserine decarboxylase family protein [Bacteroidales bacterium]